MILAIPGSLQRSSVNSAALRAAARAAARDGIVVKVDDAPRHLPHFDPDLELAPPEPVVRFRRACESAAGVLLAVPEYAFGIPGTLKNALDWTVRSGSLYQKTVTVLDVAPPGRGAHVREALDHVLTAIAADVIRSSVLVTEADRGADGEIRTPRVIDELGKVVAALAHRAGLDRAA